MGANAPGIVKVKGEEGGDEAARLSEKRVVFGVPTLSCSHRALKWSLAWRRGVAEWHTGVGNQWRGQRSSFSVPGLPIGWVHNCFL